jgi:hypothetical protein
MFSNRKTKSAGGRLPEPDARAITLNCFSPPHADHAGKSSFAQWPAAPLSLPSQPLSDINLPL